MAHGHPALVVSLLELSSQMTQVRDASMFGEFQNLILLLIMSKSSKIAAKDNKQQAFVDSVLWLLLSLSSVEIMLCTFVHLSTFVPFLGNTCLSIPMLMLKWRNNTKREQTLDCSPLLLLPCHLCRGFVGHSDNGWQCEPSPTTWVMWFWTNSIFVDNHGCVRLCLLFGTRPPHRLNMDGFLGLLKGCSNVLTTLDNSWNSSNLLNLFEMPETKHVRRGLSVVFADDSWNGNPVKQLSFFILVPSGSGLKVAEHNVGTVCDFYQTSRQNAR